MTCSDRGYCLGIVAVYPRTERGQAPRSGLGPAGKLGGGGPRPRSRGTRRTAVNVVVCVKLVPDPDSVGQLDATTHRLRRDLAESVLDPADEFGVEAGLRLVEAHGGEVRVVSMGPERAMEAVRKALAVGGARGGPLPAGGLGGASG